MKGGFGCSPCCARCDACMQECVEPHTGDPFEVVYTKYAAGVEVGNPSDGYLFASGDNDTSDPYDGMDGFGPWSQEITAVIQLGTSRIPCTTRISFWRQSFTVGPSSPGSTPSSALTLNEIEVICTAGEVQVLGPQTGAILTPDGTTSTILENDIPSIAGDATATTNTGVTVQLNAVGCQPTATVQITARIEWNVKQRQHVLYGLVRECYEEEYPCTALCDGQDPVETVYVEFGSFTPVVPEGENPPPQQCLDAIQEIISGQTYVLNRLNNFCFYWGVGPVEVAGLSVSFVYEHWSRNEDEEILLLFSVVGGACIFSISQFYDSEDSCASEPYSETGTATVYYGIGSSNSYSIGTVTWTATS